MRPGTSFLAGMTYLRIAHSLQEVTVDTLSLIILAVVGYSVFVLLFIRFIGMLRNKDNAMTQQ